MAAVFKFRKTSILSQIASIVQEENSYCTLINLVHQPFVWAKGNHCACLAKKMRNRKQRAVSMSAWYEWAMDGGTSWSGHGATADWRLCWALEQDAVCVPELWCRWKGHRQRTSVHDTGMQFERIDDGIHRRRAKGKSLTPYFEALGAEHYAGIEAISRYMWRDHFKIAIYFHCVK